MILLGWPVVAWQWSFGQSKSNIDTAGQRVALEHVLNQVLYNKSIRDCFEQGDGGVVLNLAWTGNSPPTMNSYSPGRTSNQAFDSCLKAATTNTSIRWITPEWCA